MRLRALCLGTLLGVGAAHSKPPHHFVLTSPDARLAVSVPESIPRRQFDCAGGNQSPALLWSGAPSGTQSFVVTLFDRDERSTPSGWWHWVVYDLPKNPDRLPMGAGTEHSQLLPADAQQGRTDLGTDAYHGPCPAEIEYADIHELQGFSKTAGLEIVGLGGFGDARWMVMG